MHAKPVFLRTWAVLVLPSLKGRSRLKKDIEKGMKGIKKKSRKSFFMKNEQTGLFKLDVSFYSSSLLPYFLYMSSSPSHTTVFLPTLS